jgi:glycosyltransferase involved in cell wall biosynthesis
MNHHPPVISIITPSYNQAGFISETIESILSQAGDFRIEYLVMDGGSTDNSAEIIRQYAERVTSGDWQVQCAGITMHWVSERDKGQADAINKGMRRCTGDIVSYINSDDAYCPGAFQQVVQAFSAQPQADLIFGDGDVIDEHGNLQWEWLSRPYDHKVMTSYHFLWNDFTNYIMQQATFWRKMVIDKIGYFDETFHFALDVEYWIRAGEAGLQLQHIPVKLGRFRMIPGTKSLSSLTAFWGDYLEIFRRYQGNDRMTPFFTYYYYNLAKQCNYNLDQLPNREPKVFKRWEALPESEKQQIDQQAKKGLALSYLLVANDLLLAGSEQAQITWSKAVAENRYLRLHPYSLRYYLKRLMGPVLSKKLNAASEKLIIKYKMMRYSRRYLQTVGRSG